MTNAVSGVQAQWLHQRDHLGDLRCSRVHGRLSSFMARKHRKSRSERAEDPAVKIRTLLPLRNRRLGLWLRLDSRPATTSGLPAGAAVAVWDARRFRLPPPFASPLTENTPGLVEAVGLAPSMRQLALAGGSRPKQSAASEEPSERAVPSRLAAEAETAQTLAAHMHLESTAPLLQGPGRSRRSSPRPFGSS